MTAPRLRVRRPYAFRGRHLTTIDLAEQVERHAALRDLREALARRLGEAVAQEEVEATLAQALDDLGDDLLAEASRDIDAILRTWSRLADAYRTAGDRAEMGRVALELGDLPGRLEERVHLVPNAGGLIDAAIPSSLVARLRYPVAAGRVTPEQLSQLGQRLKDAMPRAVSQELLRAEALDRLVHEAVQPLLAGLRAQDASRPSLAGGSAAGASAAGLSAVGASAVGASAVGPSAVGPAEPELAGGGWQSLSPPALVAHLSQGALRLERTWAPRSPPSADHLPQAVEAIALSADGQRAIWGPWEPWVHELGGTEAERRLGPVDGRAWWRHCLAAAITPDGRRGATGGAGITIWDLAAGRAQIDLAEAELDELHALAFSPCGRWLAAAGAGGRVQVYDSLTGQSAWAAPLDEPALSVAWSLDGRRVFSGGWSGTLAVHDAEAGGLVARFDDVGGSINGVAVDPAGRCVVTGAGSGCSPGARLNRGEVALRLWDPNSGAVLRDLPDLRHAVAQVAISDGLLLAIVEDGTLRAWTLADGRAAGRVDLAALDDHPTALVAAGGRALVGSQAGWVAAFRLERP